MPVRRKPAAAVAVYLFLSAASASAYNYAEAEDPAAALFKSAVVSAMEGRWEEVKKKADEGIAMQKGHLFEAQHLRPRFMEAIGKRDVSKTAETFANLVYISIREKLHRIAGEGFRDHKKDTARLRLARKSYIDVLDGNVKKQDASRSARILRLFDEALEATGNPGLFGIGRREPDPTAFEGAVGEIESLILRSFPGFAE